MSKETSLLSTTKGIVGNIKNSVIKLISCSDNEQVFNLTVEINDYLEDTLNLVEYLENDRNKLIGENVTINKLNNTLASDLENALKEGDNSFIEKLYPDDEDRQKIERCIANTKSASKEGKE